MDYEEAVEKAPPGWRHFSLDDIARLPEDVRGRELERIPPGESDDRILRALFWTFVYHLEPEKWDELARVEPIHADLIAALPRTMTALDIGAGSGRLTEHLVARCAEVVAVEPAQGLRAMLTGRLPTVRAVGGWADSLPIEDGWSELTAACGSIGPDARVVDELRRVTAAGGAIALIGPEHPEVFEAAGWERIVAPPVPPLAHDPWVEEFFGPLDPPHEMVLIRVG
ncbi:MAG TPA: methyltransferase domain-containing protein [Candidatus Dormibacteraeota bacterium]|nr:methyltransferase domain-containing protein [Candidatus Dormibacteraeota bacterium]